MTAPELRKKLDQTLEFLQSELNQIRTGRASPNLLEDIPVRAYDSVMTVKEVGTISVADSSMLVVTPWDKSLLPAIATAIRDSELKLNPATGDDNVRVPIPALTEERRKEFTKIVSNKTEAAKQSIRNIRQDAMKSVDVAFNNNSIGEDDKFTLKEEYENIVKEYNSKIEDLAESKKEALLKL